MPQTYCKAHREKGHRPGLQTALVGEYQSGLGASGEQQEMLEILGTRDRSLQHKLHPTEDQ